MKVMIIGATSAIAYETAKLYAKDGAELFLVARNAEKLKAVCNDLQVRGARKAASWVLDLADLDRHQEMIDEAIAQLSYLDAVLIAHGTLGDQKLCEQSVAETMRELNNNALSVISILTLLGNYFEEQKKGCIAVISSVAGDRGRQYNYVYGTAKGAINTFMQGFRNRLSKSGVAVLTIKPGPIDTPMTVNHRKTPLFGTAEQAGKDIFNAINKGKDELYTPWFWRFIMLIVIHIPESIFKKLNLQ